MVKADPKQDYYADLGLSSTADAEEIKTQFRTLAKQYHPDRNPGRELEVTPKFQAVQAAHEILADPQLKVKYDTDRARIAVQNAPTQPFRKNPPAPPPPTNTFPPPPPPSQQRQAPTRPRPPAGFNIPMARNNVPPSSGADKFAAFARAGAGTPQWDRMTEAQARADAQNNFRSMRTGQAQPFPNMPPPPPPRPVNQSGASYFAPSGLQPGAPKPRRSFEKSPFQTPSDFPGMARTATPRRSAGFPPTPNAGGEDPMGARTPNAYATYRQGQQRPQVSNAQSYFPEPETSRPPVNARGQPAPSFLRHAQSSTGLDETLRRPQRPELDRLSTKYATPGGEKTFVSPMARSASVRTSPVDRNWVQPEPDHLDRPHTHHGSAPRHRSAEPRTRRAAKDEDVTSSESDTSTDTKPGSNGVKPKAVPQTRRQKAASNDFGYGFRHVTPGDPAIATPSTNANHKHMRSPQDENTVRYEYPPPPPRPSSEASSALGGGSGQMNGNSRGNDSGGHRVPKDSQNTYGPFPYSSKLWSNKWGESFSRSKNCGMYINGFPSWAVPSSVFPQQLSSAVEGRLEATRDKNQKIRHGFPSHDPFNRGEMPKNADKASRCSFSASHNELPNRPTEPGLHSVSQENIASTFSATDWDGTFDSDEVFRPTDGHGRDRKSPSRSSRPRARSAGKGSTTTSDNDFGGRNTGNPKNNTGSNSGPEPDAVINEEPKRSSHDAFLPGKFSAEEWAEKLKDQTWSIPSTELNNSRSKTPKKPSRSGPTRRGTNPSKGDAGVSSFLPHTDDEHHGNNGPDAMDLDDSISDTVPDSPQVHDGTGTQHSASATVQADHKGVDLKNMANVAPFAPSASGLRNMDDLSTTLPFESRAANGVKLHHSTTARSPRDLSLPKPPKPVPMPPADKIDQHLWERYIADMNAYLYDWQIFNKKMIEHFRSRQEQIDMSMASHWMSMVGDGPPPDAGDGRRAGYTTYMAWLEEDSMCREWWNVANERHRKCFEDLGFVRDKVKHAAGVAGF